MNSELTLAEILTNKLWLKPGEFDYSGFGLGHFRTESGDLVWGCTSDFAGRITRVLDTCRYGDKQEIQARIEVML
jgi:hypothetical protein